MKEAETGSENFLPFALPDIGEEEIEAVADAMRSGWLTRGPRAAAFEQEFVQLLGDDLHAVAVNSATAVLHLALEAVGVGPGDEVIVPSWTFTSTTEVVRLHGCRPGHHRCRPRDAQHGPCGCGRSCDPAHKSSHAAGALVGTGSSEAVLFSFHATKTMTTGEGGMVVTPNPDLANRIRTMRLHGISRNTLTDKRSTVPSWRYEVVAPGFKDNLTDPAAAMGRIQLRRACEMAEKRAAIASRYDDAFADSLDLPARPPDGDTHAWHLYVVRCLRTPLCRATTSSHRWRKLGSGAAFTSSRCTSTRTGGTDTLCSTRISRWRRGSLSVW